MFRHIDISNTAATCHVCGDLSLDFGSTSVPVCCHIDVLCLAVSCKALSQVRCSLCHIILSATTAMPNVSVQIAAAVADTNAADVTVNMSTLFGVGALAAYIDKTCMHACPCRATCMCIYVVECVDVCKPTRDDCHNEVGRRQELQ